VRRSPWEEAISTPGRTAGIVLDDPSLFTSLYRRMLLIRRFEEAVQALFLKGEVYGTTHLCSGQEAVAVGVASVLEPNDRVAATYRGHGHAIALGVDQQAFLDELLGRSTGINGGRAGSMNVTAPQNRLLGCYGIVGGSIAAAVGAALTLKRAGGVAVAYFGDGATNQGYFPECLNFAQVMKLPVLFVCENNLYGEFTPYAEVTAGMILDRPRTFGIRAEQVDGMAVWAVRAAAAQALEHVRSGAGPAFIEALTYRYVGHSRSDPAKYRPPGELERWQERDPLGLTREALLSSGVGEEELAALETEVEQEVEEMRARALSAPWPDPAVPVTEFAP
jgi:TPP-dependent pyruvate/acetoin dehydrogenase alpha subunit